MIARLASRPLLVALLIALAAEALFAFNLSHPSNLVFDETHYVTAARVLIDLDHPRNTEHPLLGKILIAAGMLMFGDNPIGWRLMSTFAGVATVVGAYWIGLQSFRRTGLAAFMALLVAIDQSVFVQARIGMLDGFLAAFVVVGIGALIWTLRAPPDRAHSRLVLAAVLFGLAVGVKWTAIPYVAAACVILLLAFPTEPRRLTERFGATFGFGLIAVAVYLTTFLPAFFLHHDPLTLAKLIPYQFDMYAQQTQVLSPHPYQSSWFSWPLLMRPLWYYYEQDEGVQRGILLIANPAVAWFGLIAVAACLWAGLRARAGAMKGHDRTMGAIGLLWVFSLAIWAIIPKSLGFFYYYHLSTVWLCLALPPAIDRYLTPRWRYSLHAFAVLALGLFIYFYPIISGIGLWGPRAFNVWMWFDSWR